MFEIITVGLDLAKKVFLAHGADSAGHEFSGKKLQHAQVQGSFGTSPDLVRDDGSLAHDLQLIPSSYVKPFVKQQKKDSADADAICETAIRRKMPIFPVKDEQTYCAAMVFQMCGLLIRHRTQVVNFLRGYVVEFGEIVLQGPLMHRS